MEQFEPDYFTGRKDEDTLQGRRNAKARSNPLPLSGSSSESPEQPVAIARQQASVKNVEASCFIFSPRTRTSPLKTSSRYV